MPKSEKIRVMISSRCKATIDYNGKSVLLSELRKVLKKEIQSIRLRSGQSGLFDCWINEFSYERNLVGALFERGKTG
jgi:hypothetical protein